MGGIVGLPVLECFYVVGCCHWAWKRCLRAGEHDSSSWPPADLEDFRPVPNICRLIMAVYEENLANPEWPPPGGYGLNLDWVIKKATYMDTKGKVPPYLVYIDHDNEDIILAIRGLSMEKSSDYAMLLDNRLGKQMFEGGYVHHGLLKAATCLLQKEARLLEGLITEHPKYTLTIAGHSLGSGVAFLFTVLLVKHRHLVANIPREKLRCYGIAPARCMSLNLAIEYADILNSIILQDDFLPRTATPLEDIFKSIFCLPCLLCFNCVRDTFASQKKILKDPRRLYVPGRVYHIVERKFCRRCDPEVRTAVPVDGRFDHIILSCTATSDHAIIWIEREATKALQVMMDEHENMREPTEQKMTRQQSHHEEIKVALQRAASLDIPRASPSYGTFDSDRLNYESAGEISPPLDDKKMSHSLSGNKLHAKEDKGLQYRAWIKFIYGSFSKDRYEGLGSYD